MKYIISEQQDDKLKQYIREVGETYTSNNIVKTEILEIVAREDAEGVTYYEVFPLFHIKGMMGPDFHMQRHLLAQFIEDVIGVPVHGRSSRFINVDNI